MATVRILHARNTRDTLVTPSEIRDGLCNGSYYEAGVVETDADYYYDNDADRMCYNPILSAAYVGSQNDFFSNRVTFASGQAATTLQDFMTETASPIEEAAQRIKAVGGTIHPAEWNGKFAQRSTQHGDLMVVDGGMVFVVGRIYGFEYITAYRVLNKVRGVELAVNPRAINEDFDRLLTD